MIVTIPEYKCRRCGTLFDGNLVYSTIDTTLATDGAITFEQNAPREAKHQDCSGANYVEYGLVSKGIGIGDLLGARDADTKTYKE